MPTEGTRDAGDDSLASLDNSAEITEKDLKEGQLRKAGQLSEGAEEEEDAQ